MKWHLFNQVLHRDLGYFFSSLTILYCLSGIALNHVNEWNPDFIIQRREVKLPPRSFDAMRISEKEVTEIDKQIGEQRHRAFDYPTADQIKIYYENGSLHLNLVSGTGIYEKLRRRPVFYESNVLHRNSVIGWKWVSDIFAVSLIVINLTGIFILRGKKGIRGRGKWLLLFGAIPPCAALAVHMMSG